MNPIYNSVPFCEIIKSYRKKKKLTLKDVAQQTDVSESYISKLERGSSIPSLEMKLKLKNLLEIPLEYFDDSDQSFFRNTFLNSEDPNRFYNLEELITKDILVNGTSLKSEDKKLIFTIAKRLIQSYDSPNVATAKE